MWAEQYHCDKVISTTIGKIFKVWEYKQCATADHLKKKKTGR